MYYKLISFITTNILKYHRTVLEACQLLIGILVNINRTIDLTISTSIWYPDKPQCIYAMFSNVHHYLLIHYTKLTIKAI